MQFAYQPDSTRNRRIQPHLLENAVLVPAKFFEFGVRTVSQEVAQDVTGLAAIQNKVQFALRRFAPERHEK